MAEIIETLLASEHPEVRYKTLVGILGRANHAATQDTREAIRTSPVTQSLLAERTADGTLPYGPYAKWYGAHWVLAQLAELHYPPGDAALLSLREQVCNWLLSEQHLRGVVVREGRTRRCASQEGNALYAMLALGIADARADELAARLMRWQWPDGGWNCDKRPEAAKSSFMETLIPLRALIAYARSTGSGEAADAAERAAEVFLRRKLFRRQQDGQVMREDFTQLCYPSYWHYNILAGLTVLAEGGFLADPRCTEALDVLESKRLPDGGFPAERRYYRVSPAPKTGGGISRVEWGGVNARRMNPWVTVAALTVLRAAERA